MKRKIENMVKEKLGKSLISVSVVLLGRLADVEIRYRDGITVTELRRWANDNIKNLLNINITRSYSDKVLGAMKRKYDDDEDEMLLIEEFLFDKSFV